jgi:purine nucleosidase
MSRIPVLLDTDIGNDIDDALCLLYLLRQPMCELVGITTVGGQPEVRAMLADALCREVGREDIPIHSGTGIPILIPQKMVEAPQGVALKGRRYGKGFQSNTAVDFLRETIRSRPGEITLLGIGPLTNIGLLFAIDPEIPSLLKRLVLMCGQFYKQKGEWNARVDPHAAAIVYKGRVTQHLSVGLDVTQKCRVSSEEIRKTIKELGFEIINDMLEVWLKYRDSVTYHDPLAASLIFQPDICRYEKGRVDVELKVDDLLGTTYWEPNTQESYHTIATDVEPDRFFDHYFSIVGNK